MQKLYKNSLMFRSENSIIIIGMSMLVRYTALYGLYKTAHAEIL